MTPGIAGIERLTERLGRQADLTARLLESLARGAAGIGEAAVASTCVHLLVVGRPGVVQVLRDADAGRVFYGRSRPGQVLHVDVFHADGEVDHRLVARNLARAARIFARDAGAHRVAGLAVERIPDLVDLQTGTGGGRASGSLIYGRRLSLRLAHRNHVHLAIGLPRALWGFAIYAVAAAEEAVLAAGLELRRVETVEVVAGRGGAPLDLSDYETASDSLLREDGRPGATPGGRPGATGGEPGTAGRPGPAGDGADGHAPGSGELGRGPMGRGVDPDAAGLEIDARQGIASRLGLGRRRSGPVLPPPHPVDPVGEGFGVRSGEVSRPAPRRGGHAEPEGPAPAAAPAAGSSAGDPEGAADADGMGDLPAAGAGEAVRHQLLARSLGWLRETGIDLAAALLERLERGAAWRDLQLPGASYEELRRWLNQLREAGLVEREGEQYRLTARGRQLLGLLLDEPAAVRTALRRLLRVRPTRPDARPGHGRVTVYDDERGRHVRRRAVRPWQPGAGGDGLAVAESVLAALVRGGLPLRLQACDLRLHRRVRRHPVDVGLVLDASASMAGSRIRAAKDLAHQLLVTTRDRVAVITFQERMVQVQVPLTRNTVRVERGLGQIQPYGLTPLAQGLEVAASYLRQARARNPLLVLITDGIPTVPYRTANPLEDAVQVARQLGQGRFGRIAFTCIGLQPNERYLRELVGAAGGRLYVVDELERDTLVSIVHRERAQRKERVRGV
ncbi:VWA domain-containing protein [Thermaerobacter sp. FW80]|uniref:VWA domain-containing protein n=1 Tax=Thermaerobacter sp. FW80 TaxID=2546351 RepID=UPI0010754C17|nr:VWA domain-containing protein [Thermaerobacter sp. FW80]QBS38012.1 VWA domain-containing protein [Thermaerobacter sp. FW80]